MGPVKFASQSSVGQHAHSLHMAASRGKQRVAQRVDKIVSPDVQLGSISFDRWLTQNQEAVTALEGQIADKAGNKTAIQAADVLRPLFEKYSGFAKRHADAVSGQLRSIVNCEASQTIKHTAGDAKAVLKSKLPGAGEADERNSRGELIAGMFNWDEPNSAISRMILDDASRLVTTAYDPQQPVKVQEYVKAVVDSPSFAPADMSGVHEANSLQQKNAESGFATRLMDNFMRPHEEVLNEHASILTEHISSMRADVNKLASEFEKPGSSITPKQFETSLQNLLKKSGKVLRGKLEKHNFGFNADQQRMLDHMHATFSHNVFKYTGDLAIGVTLTNFTNLLVPGMLLPTAAMGLARNMSLLVGGTFAQIPTGEVVTNAPAERVYNMPGAVPANNSVLARRGEKYFSTQLGAVINGLTDPAIDRIARKTSESAKERMAFFTQVVGGDQPEHASKFHEGSQLVFDYLSGLKQTAKSRQAELLKVPQRTGDQDNSIKVLEGVLGFLEPIRTHVGVAALTPQEKTMAVLSSWHRVLEKRTTAEAKEQSIDSLSSLATLITCVLDEKLVDENPLLDDLDATLQVIQSSGKTVGKEDFVKQALQENPGLASFTSLMTDSMYDGMAKDASYKAISHTVYAITAGYVVGAVAGSATTAAVSAVATPVAGTAAGVGVGIVANKVTRAATNNLFKNNLEVAANAGRSIKGTHPASSVESVVKEAVGAARAVPRLELDRAKGREGVVLRKLQDEMTYGQEKRVKAGRAIAVALLANRPDSSAMNRLTGVELANARVGNALQEQADRQGDMERISMQEDRLRQFDEMATELTDQAPGIDELIREYRNIGTVSRTLNADKATAQDLATSSATLDRDGPLLMNDLRQRLLEMATANNKPFMSRSEWRCLQAYLLSPVANPAMAAQVTDLYDELDGRNAFTDGVSRLRGSIPGLTPDQQSELNQQVRKYEDKAAKSDASIRGLLKDQTHFRNGEFALIKDPHGIFRNFVHDYRSELVERKTALVSDDYLNAREVGNLVGKGIFQIPVFAAGAALSSFPEVASALKTPPVIVENKKSGIGLLGPILTGPQSYPGNPMGPFVAGNDFNTSSSVAVKPRVDTLLAFGLPAEIGLNTLQAAFGTQTDVGKTTRTDIGHTRFVPKYRMKTLMNAQELKVAKQGEKDVKDTLSSIAHAASPRKQLNVLRSTVHHPGNHGVRNVAVMGGLDRRVLESPELVAEETEDTAL